MFAVEKSDKFCTIAATEILTNYKEWCTQHFRRLLTLLAYVYCSVVKRTRTLS